jgi:hypothetical protein
LDFSHKGEIQSGGIVMPTAIFHAGTKGSGVAGISLAARAIALEHDMPR